MKSQSQVDLLGHLPVRHRYMEGSHLDRCVLTVKVVSKEEAAGGISERSGAVLNSKASMGWGHAENSFKKLPHRQDQVKSFTIHEFMLYPFSDPHFSSRTPAVLPHTVNYPS